MSDVYRTLIVARMKPGAAHDIADVFADSDGGELPHRVGVTGRSLFHFGDDLYMHLIEASRPSAELAADLGRHPEFHDVSDRLRPFVDAYDPSTWRGPKDAMAREFYRWEPGGNTR